MNYQFVPDASAGWAQINRIKTGKQEISNGFGILKKRPISIGAEKKCRKCNFAAFFNSIYLPG
jgi:hypothetical protein